MEYMYIEDADWDLVMSMFARIDAIVCPLDTSILATDTYLVYNEYTRELSVLVVLYHNTKLGIIDVQTADPPPELDPHWQICQRIAAVTGLVYSPDELRALFSPFVG